MHIRPEIELKQQETHLEVTLLYKVPTCPCCDHPIAVDDSALRFHMDGVKGVYGEWRDGIGLEVDGRPLCVECAKEGKGKFVCTGCTMTRTSDKIHLYWSAYRVYLCVGCFIGSTAREWEKLISRYNILSQVPRRL